MNMDTATENCNTAQLGLIEGLGLLEVALAPRVDTIC